MALTGQLKDMPLLDILYICRVNKKSGVLLLASGKERGVVFYHQGRLVDAQIVSGQRKQCTVAGSTAIYQMQHWHNASFVFSYRDNTATHPVTISAEHETVLLRELSGKAHHGTHTASSSYIVTAETAVQLASGPIGKRHLVSLKPEHWHVTQLFVERQKPCTVRALADALNTDLSTVVRLVVEMMAKEILEAVPVTLMPAAAAISTPIKVSYARPQAHAPMRAVHAPEPACASDEAASEAAPRSGRSVLRAVKRRLEHA